MMNTGQSILAIGALGLLMTILLNFYTALGRIGVPLDDAQFGISATTLATTFIDMAHGLHFDRATEGQKVTADSINYLTPPAQLGPNADLLASFPTWPIITRDSLHLINYVDGLKGAAIDTDLGELGVYRTEFDVYYVNPNDVTTEVFTRQFTKRMDLAIYRLDAPLEADIDTVRMYTVMGYFKFN
jgi:hypothetical protein